MTKHNIVLCSPLGCRSSRNRGDFVQLSIDAHPLIQ